MLPKELEAQGMNFLMERQTVEILGNVRVSGEYVSCPLYDWKISLMTGKVQAPDEGEVKTYAVEIDGGRVYIIV